MKVFIIRHYDADDLITILSADSSDRAAEYYTEISDVHPSNFYVAPIPEVHADREFIIFSTWLDDDD